MELRSGRLFALAAGAMLAEGEKRVPAEFEQMVQMKLKLRASAEAGAEPRINMRGSHPLAQWGRDQIKADKKKKRKIKTAAASRRRNRK